MRKTEKNLYILYMVFATMLITANCVAAKVWDTGITLFGNPITLTCGVVAYPFTFLVTDILGEIWGKEAAARAVKGGFICQAISTTLIIIVGTMPGTDAGMSAAYSTLLGQNFMFVLASLTAYYCSQSLDVVIFHKIRTSYIAKHGTTKGGKWIWNNTATIISQLVDSIVYAVIAFGIGFGWLVDPGMRMVLFNMILGQWIFKMIVALLDTPFFYFFTRKPEA